jgi:NAD(P)-dependent dehydrogenase (short-subunit alcohol dehydrogenase family)
MPTERDSSKSEDPSPIAPLRKFAYNASKAAVNVFTVHLAAELKDTNIKVNSVHPSWVKTALGSDAAPCLWLTEQDHSGGCTVGIG